MIVALQAKVPLIADWQVTSAGRLSRPRVSNARCHLGSSMATKPTKMISSYRVVTMHSTLSCLRVDQAGQQANVARTKAQLMKLIRLINRNSAAGERARNRRKRKLLPRRPSSSNRWQ